MHRLNCGIVAHTYTDGFETERGNSISQFLITEELVKQLRFLHDFCVYTFVKLKCLTWLQNVHFHYSMELSSRRICSKNLMIFCSKLPYTGAMIQVSQFGRIVIY